MIQLTTDYCFFSSRQKVYSRYLEGDDSRDRQNMGADRFK